MNLGAPEPPGDNETRTSPSRLGPKRLRVIPLAASRIFVHLVCLFVFTTAYDWLRCAYCCLGFSVSIWRQATMRLLCASAHATSVRGGFQLQLLVFCVHSWLDCSSKSRVCGLRYLFAGTTVVRLAGYRRPGLGLGCDSKTARRHELARG